MIQKQVEVTLPIRTSQWALLSFPLDLLDKIFLISLDHIKIFSKIIVQWKVKMLRVKGSILKILPFIIRIVVKTKKVQFQSFEFSTSFFQYKLKGIEEFHQTKWFNVLNFLGIRYKLILVSLQDVSGQVLNRVVMRYYLNLQ